MKIKNQKEFFNETYKKWAESISEERLTLVKKVVALLGISEGNSVLDAACGTGILYCALKDIHLKDYLAVDISEKMLEELNKVFPEAKTKCLDFDKKITLDDKFDYVIIFNSIPHFENIDILFANTKKLLNTGGKFAIIHGRTRKGIKEHHKKIGYDLGREPIPTDVTLNKLSKEYDFNDVVIKDEDFFYFSCVSN
ncbi:class I SAM-dependent DNA methyltransferase [Clostridium sp. ZS2-4]|uniref:class I SAM-dependent DNA methyltransferase n=1 Tax=Clostridium sp. ZS2-4 TaxID=2987703 RepID=UPI00227BF854|nr:class I SAM-dependent methyltransferase [Clostridium sp. ZS2-4]MCY6356353.1 class I SAM-dependent methyltransferase [Clostridium sp. ZS2-4]